MLASLCVCRILRDAFPAREFRLVNCEVQNIVGHVELPVGSNGMLDLQSMYGKLELNCLYQRAMFPGLVWRAPSAPVVLLCFYSGKVVITGGKTTRDVYEGGASFGPPCACFCASGTESGFLLNLLHLRPSQHPHPAQLVALVGH